MARTRTEDTPTEEAAPEAPVEEAPVVLGDAERLEFNAWFRDATPAGGNPWTITFVTEPGDPSSQVKIQFDSDQAKFNVPAGYNVVLTPIVSKEQ